MTYPARGLHYNVVEVTVLARVVQNNARGNGVPWLPLPLRRGANDAIHRQVLLARQELIVEACCGGVFPKLARLALHLQTPTPHEPEEVV